MTSVMLVNATDLIGWATRRSAQDLLPHLLRRLIHATVDRISRIDLPANEGVQVGGWDGIVTVEKGNALVPDGTSAWEMSAGDPKKKADENYEKRTQNPLGIDPETSAFVFVTPQRWKKKDAWVTTKKREGKWREVRVLDADNLEDWLEKAPAVHIWLSILLGKHPEDATDLGSFWLDWSEATRPATAPALVLAGRDEIAKRIQKWLTEPQPTLAVQAEAPDEALAIFAAALHQFPVEERISHLSRAVVVRSLPAWNRLTALEEPLLLVPLFDSPDIVARAVRGDHRVMVPLGRSDSAADDTLIAPRLSREQAADALVSEGLDKDQARRLATVAWRSLTSFRRKRAIRPEMHQPAWARPAEALPLLPAMLAGTWNEAKEGDRQALASLAGVSYDEVSRVLVRWSNESYPPVRRIGDLWTITLKEDALSLLGRYLSLSRDLLLRFEEVAIQVLGTPDPRYDLPEDKWPLARALEVAPEWSDHLYKGIADTLAALGERGGKISIFAGSSAADMAAWITRKILDRANADWRVFASLSDAGVLQLLAEAAPDDFLAAVEEGLTGEHPLLCKLFEGRRGDTWGYSSQHLGLLWALETLAWSPDYLGRVALLLAKLARLDQGGRNDKRPQSSLRDIFLLWHPQTGADLGRRLGILDLLREREPEVAWQLLLNLLPQEGGWTIISPRFRWREWVPDSFPGVTREEWFRGSREISNRILADVGEGASRWRDVIQSLVRFPEEAQNLVLDRLATMDLGLNASERSGIWDTLRELIALHRRHPTAHWVLSEDVLDQLDSIYLRFEPDETLLRCVWLFTGWPEMPRGRLSNWKEEEEAVERERLAAVHVLYEEAGLPGLLKLAGRVEQPDVLGSTLGHSKLLEGEEDDVLREHLAAEEPFLARFTRGFVCGRIWSRGREWGEQKLASLATIWTPRKRAELLVCLPVEVRTLTLAESMGRETEHEYWCLVNPRALKTPEEAERAARKLLEHGRPFTAVDFLARHPALKRLPQILLVDALERVLKMPQKEEPPSDTWSRNSLDLLDLLAGSSEVDERRLIALELAFLPLIASSRRPPKILHRELAQNPESFAEVVTWVYPQEGGEVPEVSEEAAAQAKRGLNLLDSGLALPGTLEDDTIDAGLLKDWVWRAREATAAKDRKKAGDYAIGRYILSASPLGTDGIWPHEAVRQVIEEVASSDLDAGFKSGIHRSRGVVRKAPTEGGEKERELAARYAGWAALLRDRWHRTAEVLRHIEDFYRGYARHQDHFAEQVELEL